GMFEQVLALPFQAVLDIIQKVFKLAPLEQLIFNSKDLNLIAGAGTVDTGNAFANALLNLALAGFTVYFNAVYTIRHWVVTAALVATPLIAWIWVLTSERQVIEIWAAEIFQTIFLQSAHALTLGVFLSVLCGAAGGGVDTSRLGGGLRDIAVWIASFGGAVCVMVIVFLGYKFMTARNEKEAAQAREGLVRTLAGLAVLGLALTIAGFLVYLFNGKWY
ncbi:MAG: pilin, partial [Desulfofundulus sp.]